MVVLKISSNGRLENHQNNMSLVVSGETMKLCYPSLLGESLLDTQMQANLDQRAMVQLA